MRRAAGRRQFEAVVSPQNGHHGCGGKRCYPDFPAANHVAKIARGGTGCPLQPYRCRYCTKWHIGEPNQRADRRKERRS